MILFEVKNMSELKKLDLLRNSIERYVKADILKSAIMLSGPWGVGKSYFINNDLKPYLKEKNYKTFSLSLYEISSIAELKERLSLAILLGLSDNSNEDNIVFDIWKMGINFRTGKLNSIFKNDTLSESILNISTKKLKVI